MPEPPPISDALVERMVPFPDLELYDETGVRSFDVAGQFRGNQAAGSITLSVEPLTPGIVDLALEGRLRVQPLAVGTAQVRVEARGENGGMAADTFQVIVLDPCPASAPTGQLEVFPFEMGESWRYDVERTASSYGSADERALGQALIEVAADQGCASGTHTFTVRETLTLTTERRFSGQPWFAVEQDSVTVQTYTWTVTDSLVTLTAPRIRVRGRTAGPPPFTDEVARFAPVGTQTTRISGPGPGYPGVVLKVGVAPSVYALTTNFGTSGDGRLLWTLVE